MRDRIGSKGPLTINDLLSPNEIFQTTLKLIEEYKKSGNKYSYEEFFGNDPGYLIWKNYVKSMTGVDEMKPLTTKAGRVKKGVDGKPVMVPKLKSVKKVKVRDENGNVVLDLIPVRFTNENNQSEGAMFDRANPTVGVNPNGSPRTDGLYRNRGTGNFGYGNDK
jgi:hypothetical protein